MHWISLKAEGGGETRDASDGRRDRETERRRDGKRAAAEPPLEAMGPAARKKERTDGLPQAAQ